MYPMDMFSDTAAYDSKFMIIRASNKVNIPKYMLNNYCGAMAAQIFGKNLMVDNDQLGVLGKYLLVAK